MSSPAPILQSLPLGRLVLQGSRKLPVKSLRAFNKSAGHREPESAGEATDAFLQSIGAAEIEEEGETLFRLIRREFDYRRRDLEATAIPGAFTLITPDFLLRLWIEGDPDNFGTALIQREVSGFQDLQLLQSVAFANAFSGHITRLCLYPTTIIDIPDLIDRLEENPKWRKGLDYPPQANELTLRWNEKGPALQAKEKEVTFTRGAEDDLLEFLQTGCKMLNELI